MSRAGFCGETEHNHYVDSLVQLGDGDLHGDDVADKVAARAELGAEAKHNCVRMFAKLLVWLHENRLGAICLQVTLQCIVAFRRWMVTDAGRLQIGWPTCKGAGLQAAAPQPPFFFNRPRPTRHLQLH